MTQSIDNRLILIYYNIRGKLQVVRSLLCYLGLPYTELHLQLIEAGTEKPQPQILSQLKDCSIDRAKLPLLVHGNSFIYGTFAINMHICSLAKRPQLFGRNEPQMRDVQKSLESLLQNQMKCKTFLFEFAGKCLDKTEREIRQLKHLSFERMMNDFPFIREICEQLQGRGDGEFTLGGLTVVDFYFWETCFYILGIFGNIDKEYSRTYESFYNSIVSSTVHRKPNKLHLDDMRKFVEKMKKIPFYDKSKELLESFSVVYGLMSEDKVEGLRKIWIGDMRYMQ